MATAAVLVVVLIVVIALGDCKRIDLATHEVPAPVITLSPSNPTSSTSATFHYTNPQSGVGFKCSIDGSPFATCAAGDTTYRGLDPGNHTFRVEAFSGSAISRATGFSWVIMPRFPALPPTPSGPTTTIAPTSRHTDAKGRASFTISNRIAPPLYPGTSQKLDLVFTNPNPSPLTIAPGTVSITISTIKAGCPASVNFAVTQGLTSSVTIPANQTKSLNDLGIAEANWPVIAMVETHSSQDACQGAPLALHYSAGGSG